MHEKISKVLQVHASEFGGNPLVVCSPGRINLIGEHTDYNLGFVLPASIDKAIYLAFTPNSEGIIRLRSIDMNHGFYETPVAEVYEKADVAWANYIIGVVDEIQKSGRSISGFDCVFGGDIPIGAGVSSSAALESGTAFGLSNLFSLDLTRLEMTKLSMQAENNFVGVNCGIMDQFAILHGMADSVMKLDCRSLDYSRYPFSWNHIRVLLCDTKVRRTLAGSEYNVRRRQCEQGVAVVASEFAGIRSLRDVSFKQLEHCKSLMDEVVYHRCLYVLNENRRVQEACEALLENDLNTFGQKMYGSHYGLRDHYEVSCEELNILVEATKTLDHVLGARMMGGGFGGCTINLVLEDGLDASMHHIQGYYHERTGIEPSFHVVKIGPGTHVIS